MPEDYNTITVPAGQTRQIRVGHGETFSNTLIDMTAKGASARIVTSGSDWTIRNVGFKGTHPGGNYLMVPGVGSSSGTGTIEHVYLGDGQPDRSLKGAIWVNANMPHRGTITIRRMHMAHLINGLYGSGPGTQGAPGNLHIYDSYFYNNTIANVRTNGKARSNQVVNTTIHIDGGQPQGGNDTSNPGTTNTRAVWAWYGECHLQDCDVVGPLATTDGGRITQTNTRTGAQADTSPPAGVPMSAEEAASGTSSTGDVPSGGNDSGGDSGDGSDGSGSDPADQYPHVISIAGAGPGEQTDYSLAIDGIAQASTQHNATIDDEDVVAPRDDTGLTQIEGTVVGGTDSFAYDGSVVSFAWTGAEPQVFIDGTAVDPGDVAADPDPLPKVVVVDGSVGEGRAHYDIRVSGQLEKDAQHGTINPFDTITTNDDGTASVTGRVIGGKDAFRYDGEVLAATIEGAATLRFIQDDAQTEG